MNSRAIRLINFLRSAYQYRGSGTAEAFDRIYEQGAWTNRGSRSGAGSTGPWLDASAALVVDSFPLHELSVLEIGCGDLAFARLLAPQAGEYYACDVSQRVIDACRPVADEHANLHLFQADASVDPLPECDLVLIRQVLQHLPNDTIAQILTRPELTKAWVVIFEHVPSTDFKPNRDLPGPGPFTRLSLASGVDPSAPPFGLPFRLSARIASPANITGALAVYTSSPSAG